MHSLAEIGEVLGDFPDDGDHDNFVPDETGDALDEEEGAAPRPGVSNNPPSNLCFSQHLSLC